MKQFFSKMAIAILVMLIAAVSAMSQSISSVKEEAKTLSSQVLNAADSAVEVVKATATKVDTSSVTKQIYADVKDAVSALASGLKVGAEHVYVILVRQSLVDAILWSISLLSGIILLYVCFLSFRNGYNNARTRLLEYITHYNKSLVGNNRPANLGDYSAEEYWAPSTVISGAVTGILGISLTIAGLCHLDTIVMGYVNPEFGAIQRIIELIK